MHRAHRLVGWLTFLTFVVTGVYLHYCIEEVMRAAGPGGMGGAGGESVRYAIRANHVYILFSGLVNLALWAGAVGGSSGAIGWRMVARRTGHLLVLGAPAVLLVAFVVEGHHPKPERFITAAGVLAVVVGLVLILIGGRADRIRSRP